MHNVWDVGNQKADNHEVLQENNETSRCAHTCVCCMLCMCMHVCVVCCACVCVLYVVHVHACVCCMLCMRVCVVCCACACMCVLYVVRACVCCMLCMCVRACYVCVCVFTHWQVDICSDQLDIAWQNRQRLKPASIFKLGRHINKQ